MIIGLLVVVVIMIEKLRILECIDGKICIKIRENRKKGIEKMEIALIVK